MLLQFEVWPQLAQLWRALGLPLPVLMWCHQQLGLGVLGFGVRCLQEVEQVGMLVQVRQAPCCIESQGGLPLLLMLLGFLVCLGLRV